MSPAAWEMSTINFPTIALLALTLMSSSSLAQDAYFKITEVSQGKLRVIDNRWNLYVEGKKFDYLPNDVCVFEGKNVPCMAYGIALRYETNLEAVDIACVSQAGKASEESSYQIKLRGAGGGHVEPSFFFLSGPPSKPYKQRTKCYWNDKKVIDYKTTITANPGDTWKTTGGGGVALYDSAETGLACARARRALILGGSSILTAIQNGEADKPNPQGEPLLKYGLDLREICGKGQRQPLEKGSRVKVLDGKSRECGIFAHVVVTEGVNAGEEGCIDDQFLEIP